MMLSVRCLVAEEQDADKAVGSRSGGAGLQRQKHLQGLLFDAFTAQDSEGGTESEIHSRVAALFPPQPALCDLGAS